MGKSQKTTCFGTLNPAKVSLQKLISSFSVTGLSLTISINAQGTSPHLSSGLATTAAMDTEGCLARVFSISIEEIFSPPEIIISFNLSTVNEYRKLVNEFMNGQRASNDLPRWLTLEKIGESMLTRFGFILLYVLFYLEFATASWQYALLPFHVFMGSMHGFIVNWFGHKRGYRNFDDIKDNSKNTLPIDFLMMGELYQNNHHRRPNNMNFAVRWFEIDLGYIATSFLKKLKVIY